MKDLFGTIGTRYLIAILNLILIFINAKILGVEGIGLVGLILAAIGITNIFCGILTGNTLVYFMNRYSMQAIFLPAYVWTPIGAGIACIGMDTFHLIPAGYMHHVYFISILTSWVTANSRFLLGKNRIAAFNLTFAIQGGFLFIALLLLYFGIGIRNVTGYIWGVYITNTFAFIISFYLLLPYLLQKDTDSQKEVSKYKLIQEMFTYGLWSSADNLAEVLTTRLNYFLIGRFSGLGCVGLLDAGTKISESVWHINRSIGFLEYNQVAQTTDTNKQKQITLQFLKLTACAVTLATGCILLLPEWIYTDYLFSSEFKGMRTIILGLSIGVITLACHSILSQYFIGSGKIRYSTYSSCVGLGSLVTSGYLLIPTYGVYGSAVSCSLAFSSMFLYSLSIFRQKTGTKWNEFLINKNDIKFVYQQIRQMI